MASCYLYVSSSLVEGITNATTGSSLHITLLLKFSKKLEETDLTLRIIVAFKLPHSWAFSSWALTLIFQAELCSLLHIKYIFGSGNPWLDPRLENGFSLASSHARYPEA